MPLILIADDEDSIRKVLRVALEAEGFSIEEASDGDEALAVIKSQEVAVCIIDILMPGKGGIETVLEVRKDHPGMKIVFITGKVPTEIPAFQNLSSQFNIDAVFTKPLEIKPFVQKIWELIES